MAAATISSLVAPDPAQLDVPADGVVEQNIFLRHDGDLVAQVARGNFSQIHAADFDRAARGVVKTQQQIGQRGFAGTAGADERDELAGFDREIDVAQHRFFAVAEIKIFKFECRPCRRGAFSAAAGSGTEFFVASISKTRSVAARAWTTWFCRRVRFFSGW